MDAAATGTPAFFSSPWSWAWLVSVPGPAKIASSFLGGQGDPARELAPEARDIVWSNKKQPSMLGRVEMG
jgi:hypothetical protein